MVKGVITIGLVAVCVLVALALGFVRDYRSLTDERVQPQSADGLSGAFEALPWNGGEDVRAYPLDEPHDAWLTRWWLLREARERVDVAYFILDGDIFGLSFLGALLAAADRGVQVRILVDGMATDMADMTHTLLGENFFNALDGHPNVQVRTYRPVMERVAHFAANLRVTELIASEHDKIINVDSRWSLTGGRNIAHQYFTPAAQDGHQFIDTDVLLESPKVNASLRSAFDRIYDAADPSNGLELQPSRRVIVDRARLHMDAWLEGETLGFSEEEEIRELEVDWRRALVERPRYQGAMKDFKLPSSHLTRARVADSTARSVPGSGEITQALVTLIENAERDIVLVNPYFALGESEASALERAAARGVNVLVLTNSPRSSDNAISQAFFLEQWPTLMARVPTMRLFVMGGVDTLHSKVMLFDEELSFVGTYNLDPTAMRMSSELMIGLWARSLNQSYRAQVSRRIDAGEPEVYEYKLKRDAQGAPLRDNDGALQVLFGPEHHLTPQERRDAEKYRRVLHGLRKTLKLEPLVTGSN